MCGRPAQVSSASERPKGGAADHGEPPHGMHPHRVSASLSEKEGSVVTAANHCFGHQRESAGRDRHMGTATCPTLGRRCSFSVLPLRWRSLANDDGRAVARRPTAARVNVGRKLWFTPHSEDKSAEPITYQNQKKPQCTVDMQRRQTRLERRQSTVHTRLSLARLRSRADMRAGARPAG